jgi:hypothetical protein
MNDKLFSHLDKIKQKHKKILEADSLIYKPCFNNKTCGFSLDKKFMHCIYNQKFVPFETAIGRVCYCRFTVIPYHYAINGDCGLKIQITEIRIT